ncbi:MAG: glycoside hydrolase [Butyrivibrio sp.]|nr:glycoside hydrolase [Butyrivibrio sp.]
MEQLQKERLASYIEEGNLSKVKQILISDPNLIDRDLFFKAAATGNFEIVKYLVEYSRISLDEYDGNHRHVLFYAARSGNVLLFKYLVEKCGMDPLEGDKDLNTCWDIVHEKNEEIEEYLEKRYQAKYDDFYRNPVRTGFFPDPSICRVGDDYYMVNSSFIFFPCIPISHSVDLVHWEIIGHAITDPKWAYLDKLEGGRGYWAPDISFYEGKFYITATYRLNDVPPVYRRQIVVSSKRPEGPYSEPAFIDEDGIDPSIFNDDDGKRYMLLNRGARIFELDKSGTKKISDATLLYYGDHKRAPEGPHLYKKDGYYYLLEAEGGTGPGHRVTISRSKELFGEYTPCPYNPIMRQDDKDAAIQRCGHGDLVETADGRWYMVYLCGRMIGDGCSILGRETALDPVTWTSDGWPIVNELKGPSAMQKKPFPDAAYEPLESDPKISPCGLFMDHMTPRPFEDGAVKCCLLNEDGHKERSYTIKGSSSPLSKVESRNIVLKRQTSFKFSYEVSLDVPKLLDDQSAGITGYYDENTFFEFGITKKADGVYIYSKEHIGDEDRISFGKEIVPLDVEMICFKMDTDRFTRTLSYSTLAGGLMSENEVFKVLSDVDYLCDEGLKRGKRFTGALVGMYAVRGAFDLTVHFHHEKYEDLK